MYFIILYLVQIILGIIFLGTLSILVYKIIYEPKAGVCHCNTRLDGKTALITGGNVGIGYETAKDLAKRGARVIIADFQNADKTVAEIKQLTGNINVEYRELHLESFDSIKKFAEDINKSIDHLDILVNNAGTGYAGRRPTKDGISIIMQVNHIGPFLLTALLLDKLVSSKPSRIVIVASAAYKYAQLKLDDFVGITEKRHTIAYSTSKLCNILWMKALAKRLPRGVTVNSVHPGIVNTNIYKAINVPYLRSLIYMVINIFFKTAEQGAQTCIHLCARHDSENSTGNHYADCKIAKIHREGKVDDLVEKVWHKTVGILRDHYQKIGEEFRPSESVLFK